MASVDDFVEGSPGDGVLSNNAKTTADVRKRPPARPRAGQSWPLVPGVFDGQRMSRAHLADAEHHDRLSCARAGDGVFAGPEQHVGQFTEGRRS